jgi:putative salt-induced outer membrane protein
MFGSADYMKKLLTGIALGPGLFVAGVLAQTPPPENPGAVQIFVCSHCGHKEILTNETVAVSKPPEQIAETVVAEPSAEVKPASSPRSWKASVHAGFSVQSGNVNSKAYNGGVDFSRRGRLYRSNLRADGSYGQLEGQTTVAKSEALGEVRRMFNESWFSYGVLSAQHDDLKDLSYRVKAGPGIGYYFIDTEELSADVSSGPLLVRERTTEAQSGYIAWRFAQGLNWQITKTFRWSASTEVVMDSTEAVAYTVAFKTGVETKINEALSLLITAEDDYDSHPDGGENVEKNDFEISTGVRYRF